MSLSLPTKSVSMNAGSLIIKVLAEEELLITERRQMFTIVESSTGVSDVLEVNLSLMTDSIDICGSGVPLHICHTSSRFIVPASNLKDFAVFARTT